MVSLSRTSAPIACEELLAFHRRRGAESMKWARLMHSSGRVEATLAETIAQEDLVRALDSELQH